MNTIAKNCAALRSCYDSLTGSWPYGSLKEQHDTMNWGTKSTLYLRDYRGGVEESKLPHPSCTVTHGVMHRRGEKHHADVGFIQCERDTPLVDQQKNNVIVLLMGVNTSKEFLNLELLDLCTEYGTVICPDMRGVGDSIHHGGRGSWVETLGLRHGCLRAAHFSHDAYPKSVKTMLLAALVGTVLLSVYSPWTAVGLGVTGLLLGGILYRAAPAFTLDGLADDVVTLLKKVELADRPTLFVGLSMGSMVANNKDFILIDVRDQNEFDAGHIEKAQFLSKGWIEAKIHTMAPNKDSTMVLYCGGGHRSLLAAKNLKEMGYRNIFSMTGGYKQWLRAT